MTDSISPYLKLERRTMADVINLGAAQAAWASKHRSCAWCGTVPLHAAKVHGRFVVACENEDCPVDVQASGATLDEVWERWNRRV